MRGTGSLASSTAYLDPTTLAQRASVKHPQVAGKLIQGKYRNPASDAARLHRRREGLRLRKALESLTHGKTIFAYNHIRTNQVVYSFSRYLRDNKILPQLIFHKKKTVPPAIRKDMWVPYFSVHFTKPELGLETYRLLRQFTIRRQLSPPEEMITNTEEFLAKRRPKDPKEAEKYNKTWNPRKGQIMIKKDRARVLMNQKATSVADLATALSVVRKHEMAEEEAEEKATESGFQKRPKGVGKAAWRRKCKARAEREAHEEKVRGRVAEVEKDMSERMNSEVKITNAPEKLQYHLEDGQFMILWNDIQDREHSTFPEEVIHRELLPTRGHTIGHAVKPEAMEMSNTNLEEATKSNVKSEAPETSDKNAPTITPEPGKDNAAQEQEEAREEGPATTETKKTKKEGSSWTGGLKGFGFRKK